MIDLIVEDCGCLIQMILLYTKCSIFIVIMDDKNNMYSIGIMLFIDGDIVGLIVGFMDGFVDGYIVGLMVGHELD